VLVISDVQAFSAGVSFADRAVLVRADFDNTVVFNFDFKAAADSAHYAGSLLPFFHDTLLSQNFLYNILRRSPIKKIGLLTVCSSFLILSFDQHGAEDRRFRIAVKLLCPFHKFFKSVIPNIH
jgi:hypothetical protein